MEIVRLGQGIDRTGLIAPESMDRTLAMTREYAAQCRELGAARVRFVATSASRDARNAGDFVAGVRTAFEKEWGAAVEPEVVSGDEEATLSFTGTTGDLVAQGVTGPDLVVDLGGGSTEFVRGTDRVEAERSVDEVLAACTDLLVMTRAERAALPYMHPGRVDVIGAGALVWRRIIERVARDSGIERVIASESYFVSRNWCAAIVVTVPASPTSACTPWNGTTCAAASIAASMSRVAAAISSAVGGSLTRCRSVIRTQPMSTDRSASTRSVPRTNSVEPPPRSTTR
jgi:exopolyphosphatase/pppGpp-phosphohydrolase